MSWPIKPETLIQTLSSVIGIPLKLVEESFSESKTALTAKGTFEFSSQFKIDATVELWLSDVEANPQFWALVFLFIAGKRIAPANQAYMTFFYSEENQQWNFSSWEADDYDEWPES